MPAYEHIATLLLVGYSSANAFIVYNNPCFQPQNSLLSLLKLDVVNNEQCSDQSKRSFISYAVFSPVVSILTCNKQTGLVPPAAASYGDTSSIAFPSYWDFLVDRNAVVDTSKALYKGADTDEQIKRMVAADFQLSKIPAIATDKKWSQVQGILTGPLGTLIMTMNTLSKDSNEAKKAAAKVKGDIILIGQEASKKNADGCVKATDEAQKDLEAFVKIVF